MASAAGGERGWWRARLVASAGVAVGGAAADADLRIVCLVGRCCPGSLSCSVVNADKAPQTRPVTRHIPNYRAPLLPFWLAWTLVAPRRAVNVHVNPPVRQWPTGEPITARHIRIIGVPCSMERGRMAGPDDHDPTAALAAPRPPPDRRLVAARPPPDCRLAATRPPLGRRSTATRLPLGRRPTAARPPLDRRPTATRHFRIVGLAALRNTAGRGGSWRGPRRVA